MHEVSLQNIVNYMIFKLFLAVLKALYEKVC